MRDLIEIGLGRPSLIMLSIGLLFLSPVSSMGINIHDPLVQIKGAHTQFISHFLALTSPL